MLSIYQVRWFCDEQGDIRETRVLTRSESDAVAFAQKQAGKAFLGLASPLCTCRSDGCNICDTVLPTTIFEVVKEKTKE